MAEDRIPRVILLIETLIGILLYRDDPSTDFRGMGILGLENLLFYAQHDSENCRRLLRLSENEVYGFPFAIAGITFTALCKQVSW